MAYSRSICLKCAKSYGGVAYNPLFFYCDGGEAPQNWPSVGSGIPYINNGGNVTGWSSDKFSNGTASSDGTVISLTSSPISAYTLPVVVTGDFTAHMEVMFDSDLAQSIEFTLFDNDFKKALRFLVGSASVGDLYLEVDKYCEFVPSGVGYTVLSHVPFPGFSPNTWYGVTLTRIGSSLTLSTTQGFSTTNATASNGFILAISKTDDGVTWKIRNISVTSP